MKLKKPKSKGYRGEVEFAKLLSQIDLQAKRMVLSGAVQGFQGDIWSSIPIIWEVKYQETWSPLKYYRQAQNAVPIGSGKIPAVAMRSNRTSWFVFFEANDFIQILARALKDGWPD